MMAVPASIGVSAPVRARLPLGVADGVGAGVVGSPVRVSLMLKEKAELVGMCSIVTVMVLPSSLALISPRP